ncbi:type II toxin-antitoxin system RelE/ParE family toxin [Bradyrhizobium sp.]|uniref:type II toxin-antitoxin system RelE/ParE family toxin n=1 Tax=Bradyrhizobium sp. TaxID=376 RepID=UPI002E0CD8A4|nr:type II toxin-antitoxin system RelE/ParE family toxin [Bradyrhizobium sp.]
MIEVRQTREFFGWLRRLKDDNAATRIVGRIRRMEQGNPGDVGSVGMGVMEMRIDYGPGYRVYFVRRGSAIAILLCAGDHASNRHQTSARARSRNSRGAINDRNDTVRCRRVPRHASAAGGLHHGGAGNRRT